MVNALFTSEPDAAHLSDDRSEAWLVVSGDGPEAVGGTMESLTLYPYMEIRGIVEVQEIALPPAEPGGLDAGVRRADS